MPDNKIVLHFRRIKTIPGNREVLKHNLRQNDALADYLDSSKSSLNCYEGATVENFAEKYQEMINNAHLKRKIQKNASRIIEFVVSASHAYKNDWETNPQSKATLDAYFEEARNFFRWKYGDVAISSAVHFDETTPHMHLLCVPLVKAKDGQSLKFSSSEFLGGIKQIQDLHTQFFEEVGKQFGLERGNLGSRASHSDIKQYKEWEASQRLAIARESKELADRTEQEQAREDEANNRIHRLAQKEEEWAAIEKQVNQQTPVVPVPPALAGEAERRFWQKKVQESIAAAFKALLARYTSLVNKFRGTLEKNKALVGIAEHWKNRAEKAEGDLAAKPLDEIKAERERRNPAWLRQQGTER
jgi:hypothetical protein